MVLFAKLVVTEWKLVRAKFDVIGAATFDLAVIFSD